MPRTFTYSLRVAAIEAAKPKDKTYVLTDGGGLHMDVLPSGTKVWRYKYHFGGNYAIRNLQAESNPALMVRGAVSVPKRTHHRHLLEPELARFWRLIPRQGAHFTTQAATQLLVYTMVRKGELIRSRWGEYDLDAAIWDIPAERMKMRKRHRIFLSRQAVELLRLVHTMTGHQEYVFPSIFTASGRVAPMSDVSLNHFFKRMDFGVPDFR